MFRKVRLIGLILLTLALAACNRPNQAETASPTPENLLETLVATQLTQASASQVPTQETASPTPPPSTATATPEPSATPTPTLTPTPPEYNLSGAVCYPGGDIPAMTIYFQETQTNAVVELPIPAGQKEYEINLPPGTYQAYAWLPDFSRGGLYSQAVACGLKKECSDHTILPFTIQAGQKLEGIDLCDWYAGPFNVPYPPGKESGQIAGSISGALNYPGGGAPSLNVVAFNLTTNYWYYINTLPGAGSYTIPNLPPGTYHVVAYAENGESGGHADSSHSLIDVAVKAGEVTPAIDITDWNAPGGSFPPDPTR